jgi:hypothetical protein
MSEWDYGNDRYLNDRELPDGQGSTPDLTVLLCRSCFKEMREEEAQVIRAQAQPGVETGRPELSVVGEE